jgi:hypothetical protein
VNIIRRLGTSPAQRGSLSGANCPDILQLDTGDYLIIGKTPGVPNISARELAQHGASIGDGEQAVIVPRDVVHAAAAELLQRAEPHIYLSTGCLHGDHAYCQNTTGLNGTKQPAECKHCAAPCRCSCHQPA